MRETHPCRGVHPFLRPTSWLMAIVAVMLLTMPGCSGCGSKKPPLTAAQKKKQAEEKKKKEDADKKKKKRKPDFETTKLKLEPVDPQVVINYAKPGHWVSTQQLMRANNFDFPALVVTKPTDGTQKPVLIEGTPYHLKVTRPAALAKGQAKYVESLCPIPATAREGRRTMVSTELLQRRSGTRAFGPDFEPVARMMSYQFLFVVLSSNPDNFTYVKTLDSIDPPLSDEENNREVQFYHVISPRIDKRVPVPSHSMTWTPIAYMLWDQVNTDLMTQQQKNAMIDWLHWGGQLIINGPNNLESLKTSFLSDYLPADHDGAAELTAEDFEAINKAWTLPSQTKKFSTSFDLLEDQKLLGVRLALRPGATLMANTGGMVAEMPVGRGRVVTTAFSLAARPFKNWKSADNFFNNCILRRPARTFDKDQAFMPTMRVADNASVLDPRSTTQTRYFTRDLPPGDAVTEKLVDHVLDPGGKFQGFVGWKGVGVGGWNDHSGASVAARAALKQAAGITVPEAGFVLKSVGIYLLVLVPLNWVFFRMIGRVEWAWVAAPIIAVIGSLFVVKFAQLDIGFARSMTETAVLEMHNGYGRGHLTRYSALYTSLSTDYDLVLDDQSSLAMPFSPNLNFVMRLHDRQKEVVLKRESKVTLSGFQVASNSTGMLHSEQMVDVGPIVLEQGSALQLNNQSSLKLLDAMVMRRRDDGVLETCYLGAVEPATSRPVTFAPAESDGIFPQWEDSRTCAFSSRQSISGSLSLATMGKLATQTLGLRRNEQRLVAWTDQAVPGAATNPAPAQTLHRTMILVHLSGPGFEAPQSDVNLRIDFTEDDDRVLEKLDEDDNLYRDDSPTPVPPGVPGNPLQPAPGSTAPAAPDVPGSPAPPVEAVDN